MSDTSSYIEGRVRRRRRSERAQWDHRAAILASLEPRDRAAHIIARPYLLAHPEREIAEVRWVGQTPCIWCAACGGLVYPIAALDYLDTNSEIHGRRIEHNALIHPRRAARLTQ